MGGWGGVLERESDAGRDRGRECKGDDTAREERERESNRKGSLN